ncbi:MAG: glycosyltransferase, partial [Deltaproteobacteria bacterium]|nr:glycosyltransferase [Deltaproteobacteria bacterium]
MRIWLLTSELPQEIAGGIARYVDNFARLLGAAGHEVVVIARTTHACDKLMAPGVRLIGITPRDTYLNEPLAGKRPEAHPAYPYNILAYWPALSYQMAEEVLRLSHHLLPPDLIESQEYAALPYYLLQRKLTERTPLARTPILVHLHSPWFELARVNRELRYRFPEYWVGQMEKFCVVSADALLSPSYHLAQSLKKTLQLSAEITRIPYPFVVPDGSVPTEGQPRHIVYVGRLEVRKGVLRLVNACSSLWAAGEDFRLTLIGGDADLFLQEMTVGTFIRQYYQRWMESGHLELVGQLGHAAALEAMRQAWAVVVPSLWENFPYTCLEGMGVGQVVLASLTGGQAEMIQTEGVDGFLFDWNVPGDFEHKLRRVLTLSVGERMEIARHAQARIRALCAPEVILPQRLHHYDAVIARCAPRRTFPTVNSRPVSEDDTEVWATQTMAAGEADLLSVVLPYSHMEALMGETLESLLASTHAPGEIIIVNDGSTEEKSLAALRELEGRGLSSLRILHTAKQGFAMARTAGAEAARGEFVAFMDVGDVVVPEFFDRAIFILRRYLNVAFVYSWVCYCGLSSTIWPTWNAELPYLLGHPTLTPFAVVRRSAYLRWARNTPPCEAYLADCREWMVLLA